MRQTPSGLLVATKPGEMVYCPKCDCYHVVGSDRFQRCGLKSKNKSLDAF